MSLPIADSTLHHWCKLFSDQGDQEFPGSGHQAPEAEELRRLKRELEVSRQERDILKKALAIFSRSQRYPISTLCRVLGVSVSGYYDWRGREPSQHEREDGELATHIHRIFSAHRQVYGSPRVHVELRSQGIGCSKERVARLMREMDLCAKPRRNKKVGNKKAQGRLSCSQAAQPDFHRRASQSQMGE